MIVPKYAYCERFIGSEADTNELEYVSALHQTSLPTLRTDCTISSEDVRLYLRSKYGIVLTHEDAVKIVDGLGGTILKEEREEEKLKFEQYLIEQERQIKEFQRNIETNTDGSLLNANESDGKNNVNGIENEENEEIKQSFLDLIQIVSIMLIPTFLRAEDDKIEDNDADSDEIEYRKHNPNHDTYINNDVQAHYPPDIFQDVLHLFVSNVEESKSKIKDDSKGKLLREMKSRKPTLTKEFIRDLLLSYHQTKAAENKELIQEMLDVAGGEGSSFSEMTLIKALTSDVKEWKSLTMNNNSSKSRLSSSFGDVFGIELRNVDSTLNAFREVGTSDNNENAVAFDDIEIGVDEDGNEIKGAKKLKIPRLKRQGRAIDYVMDSFGSITFTVMIFVFFIFFSVTVVMVIKGNLKRNGYCAAAGAPDFKCVFIDQLVAFIILGLTLVITGLTLIYPLSIGANTSTRLIEGKLVVIIAMLLTLLYCIVPFELYQRSKMKQPVDNKQVLKSIYFQEALIAAFVTGILTCALFIVKILPKDFLQKQISCMTTLFVPNDIKRTASIKLATVHKLNKFLENAQLMHFVKIPSSSSYSSQVKDHSKDSFMKFQVNDVMTNYLTNGKQVETFSTMQWSWRGGGWNVAILRKEGVWIHSRLIIGQITQFVMGIYFVRSWFWVHDYYIGYIDNAMAHKDLLTPEQIAQIPLKWMITASFIPGLIVGIYVGMYIISAYVPSTVNTIFQLRCGKIPTLYDPRFILYRKASETIYQNIGNMIFSFLGCIFVFFAGTTYFFFMCFYPPYQPFMATVAAAFCAIFITLIIRVILMISCRKKYFQSFYRQEPLQANLSSLCMEAWNIGLGAYTIIKRLFVSFIAAAFWIGRVDITFLSENVNYKGFGFDTAPLEYRKEILVHEAHHHPYLERLGAMYMMRLKYGRNFSNNAGIWWRNLFVIALMPWLSKYRKSLKESKQEQQLTRYYEWAHVEDQDDSKKKLIGISRKHKGKDEEQTSNDKFNIAAKRAMYLYKLNKEAEDQKIDIVPNLDHDEIETVFISEFVQSLEKSKENSRRTGFGSIVNQLNSRKKTSQRALSDSSFDESQ